MKTIACFALLLCAAALAFGARAAGEAAQEEDLDVVIQFNLNAPPVPPTKVIQDNYLLVKGQFKGAVVSKEGYLVKDIIYADKDANYQLALEKRDEGRHTLAALHFSNALDSLKDRKWAAEYCNYNIGNAFYLAQIFDGYGGRQRKYAPAAEYFKRALDANPKSRYLLDIVTKLPICYAEMSDDHLNEAEAALKDADERIKKYKEETAKITTTMGYNDAAKRASVQLAIAKAVIAEKQAARGKPGATWPNAASLWRDARSKTREYPELAGDAVEGELRALIQMKEFDKAVQEATLIINKYNKESDYGVISQMPAAYMALGKANYFQALKFEADGNAPMSNNAFAEARWAFLNVIVQFSGNDESLAQAHYLAGLCYEKLITAEPADAKVKAIREWQSVVANFPKSDSMEKAVVKLKEHGVKVDDIIPAKPVDKKPPAAPK